MAAKGDERHKPSAAYASFSGIPPALLQRNRLAHDELPATP
jgi:hypothetical protein